MKRLNLVETINTMVDFRMNVSPGDALLAMVMDTVTGRKSLYHLEESLHDLDPELIIWGWIINQAFSVEIQKQFRAAHIFEK